MRPIALPDVPYDATAVRPDWSDLPETVRAAITARLGSPVIAARSAGGGFTRAFAAVLETGPAPRVRQGGAAQRPHRRVVRPGSRHHRGPARRR